MTAPLIRPATSEDVPALGILFDAYRVFYEQPSDPERATQFIGDRMSKHQSLILVAEMPSAGLAGFCQVYPGFCSVEAAPIHVLYDLYVDPGFRRNGVAKALLHSAETQARSHGAVRMDLMTARTNVQAQKLYESQGWIRDEVFFTYNRTVK